MTHLVLVTLPLVSKQTDISEKGQAKSQASKSDIMEQRKKLVLEQIKLGENVTTPLLEKELGVSEDSNIYLGIQNQHE